MQAYDARVKRFGVVLSTTGGRELSGCLEWNYSNAVDDSEFGDPSSVEV